MTNGQMDGEAKLGPHHLLLLFAMIRSVVKSFKVPGVEVVASRMSNEAALTRMIDSTPKKTWSYLTLVLDGLAMVNGVGRQQQHRLKSEQQQHRLKSEQKQHRLKSEQQQYIMNKGVEVMRLDP